MSTNPCRLIQSHSVLQPLKCVSHENRRAHHGIKWSRRLFSCLTHMQCMELSCANQFPNLQRFQQHLVHMPDIYTFHVNHPMQPLCVLQPLTCVSHENRPARHAIKWSRRLFSCLAHMQCMEPSCTNKFTDLKPFQKNFVYGSLTSLLFCMLTPIPLSPTLIFI